jgi:hypothetical protein
VYRAGADGEFELLAAPVLETSFTDTAPIAGDVCYRVSAIDAAGREGAVSAAACMGAAASKARVAASDEPQVAPWRGLQVSAHPNPFNPHTAIRFILPDRRHVAVRVYNVRGQLVTTLFDGVQDAGEHAVIWNGRTDGGAGASSGIYFVRVQAGDVSDQRKIVLLQ